MPAPDDDLNTRVANLERALTELRQHVAINGTDSAAARVLASGADRDTSEVRAELRAHTQVLNALGENQVKLREAQVEQDSAMRAGFAKVDAGFAVVNTSLDRILTLLESQ